MSDPSTTIYGEITVREHYRVPDHDRCTYRLDVSNDAGNNWNEGQIEMTFRRVEQQRERCTE